MHDIITKLFASKAQHAIRLCIACKHFKSHQSLTDSPLLGLCTRRHKINLVDGHRIYNDIEIERMIYCKGWWWEPPVKK